MNKYIFIFNNGKIFIFEGQVKTEHLKLCNIGILRIILPDSLKEYDTESGFWEEIETYK